MILFDYVDDETLCIYYNDTLLILVDHDYDGWNGMARVRNSYLGLCEVAGIEYKVKGDPNV